MNVALLQLNPTIGDFAGNVRRLRDAYRAALEQGAELAVTPELYLCGYPPRDLVLRDDFIRACEKALLELAPAVGDVPLLVGTIERNPARPGRPLYNAAALLLDGRIAGHARKILLPTYDVFDEDRYFEPGAEPFAFEHRDRRVGVTICEDVWNDEDFWPERLHRRDPFKELAAGGIDLMVNLSASPWYGGKQDLRYRMLARAARDEGVPAVQVNLVGGNDELIFDGHSFACNAQGGLLPLADGASLGHGFREHIALVDLGAVSGTAFAEDTPPQPPEMGLLAAALQLGVRDYVHKCGFDSVIIGLSGGIDSAVVAAVATAALGPEKVLGVAMPSKYSSEGSKSDAQQLAENLGIRFAAIPIAEQVAAIEGSLDGIFAGREPDITEENIQSRVRGLTLMALSNKFGALVLTTGNKSELAVGYCTLYGDMCGALSVISDVPKTDVYRLAHHLNEDAGREVIPTATLTKPPSAELRPDQTDQDSLPPYDTLDAILSQYIVDDIGTHKISSAGFDPDVVRDIVNKVTFSEYKRRQAAPGLKVSPRAFGVGRRIPVAQRFRG
ncbi:MAG: NAD+ synthase [Verrucomicrobiota bacterium]